MSFRKGDLVMIDPNDPEIERMLGWGRKEPVRYMASRPATSEEREMWRERKRVEIKEARDRGEDTFDIAFDSAGDSRLAPMSISVPLPIDRVYAIQRARCQVELGWGRATGGMAKVLDTHTGEVAYLKRNMLKPV